MLASLRQPQNTVVSTVWITYALFYLGRVNVSVVLPFLALALDVSRAEVGALGTIFFWVYGIGHFFSGEISSHLSPFRMVSAGLLVIALANIAFAFQTSLVVMLVLWGINGIGQSAGWSPMMRILAERLDRGHIKRMSTLMPFSYMTGTTVTWILVGAIASVDNWRTAFWLPGLLLLGALAFWRKAGIDAPRSQSSGFRASSVIAEMRAFWFALVTAALAGFVFNGALLWLPTFFLDSGLIPDHLVGFIAALSQVSALIGLLLARALVVRFDRVLATMATMLLAAGIAFLLMTRTSGIPALLIVAIGLVPLNGAFGLVVSSMPLLLAPPGRTSSITGIVNMMSTFFGGMAGFSIGALVEASGWTAVFGLWGVLLFLASALIWSKRRAERH